MYSPVSVCIPAYNEEATITSTLTSIVNQSFPNKMEILVCANGCTDDTEGQVRQFSQSYPDVKLISTNEKGKPNAWNILREATDNNFIFFTDADVHVDKEAFRLLYDRLENNAGLIAVGGMPVPYLDDSDFFTRMITPPPGPEGCLIGRLYLVNNQRLQERMEMHGCRNMPKEILSDDLWVSWMVGKQGWEIDTDARVYYRPYNLKEMPRIVTRNYRGGLQMESMYPELSIENYERAAERLKRQYHKLINADNIFDMALRLLGYVIGSYFAHSDKGNTTYHWEISVSSKRPIPMD